MGEPQADPDDPQYQILHDQAALGAINRKQLLALAKRWGVKGVGKNPEIAANLFARGQVLAADIAAGRVTPVQEGEADDKEEEPKELEAMEMDTTAADWSIVPSMEEMEIEQKADDSQEFGLAQTIAKSSSIVERGSSLAKRLGDTIKSVASTSTASSMDIANSTAPSIYPSLPTSLNVSGHGPLPAPTSDFAFDPAGDEDQPGIRLVTNSSSPYRHSPSSSPMKPPGLHTGATNISASPFPTIGFSPLAESTPARSLTEDAPPRPRSMFVFGSSAAAGQSFEFGGSTMDVSLFDAPRKDVAQEEGGLSAAQKIMMELNNRVLAGRGEGGKALNVGVDGFAVVTPGESGGTKGKMVAKEKMGTFDGKHKRAFDKMDSIMSHYAANRGHPTVPAPGASTSSAMKRPSPWASLGTSSLSAAKRLKTSATTSLTTERTDRQEKKKMEKKMVAALRDEGWTAISPPPVPSKITFAETSAAARIGEASRSKGTFEATDEEKARKKRQMELAKARRLSGAGTPGVSGRRRSTIIGRQPKTGNVASRFLKTTLKKLGGQSSSSTTRPPPLPPKQPLTTSTSSTATATRPVPFSFSAPTSSSLAKKQQPSIARIETQSGLTRANSVKKGLASTGSLARSGSTSRITKPSPSVVSRQLPTSSSLQRSSSHSRPVGGLTRQLSARVANPSLLGVVKPPPTQMGENETEPLALPACAEEAKEEMVMALEKPEAVDLLSADGADIPKPPPSLFASLPSLSNTLSLSISEDLKHAASSPRSLIPLQVQGNNSPAKAPFRPNTKSSPAKGGSSSAIASGRKTVSSAGRAIRDGNLKARSGASVEGLESRARMVAVKKSGIAKAKAAVAGAKK
ncbi:hypothetical protein T439DRAFT_379104 [Meredithblackwellia eburnea MCA 4105]